MNEEFGHNKPGNGARGNFKKRHEDQDSYNTKLFQLYLAFNYKETYMRMEQKAMSPRLIRSRVYLPALSTRNRETTVKMVLTIPTPMVV